MIHAAHPVITGVSRGYDGTRNCTQMQLKRCDLTEVETKGRGPTMAARSSSGRSKLFEERLDRDKPEDPETGAQHCLVTIETVVCP